MDIGQMLLEYSSRKFNAEYEAERRLTEAKEKVPEFARLADEKNAIKVQALRAKLSGKTEDISEKLAEYDARISSCLKAANINTRDFLPNYTCKTCKDTGMVREGYCPCLYEKIYIRLYGAQDIYALKGTFEDFDTSLYSAMGGKPTPRDKAQSALKLLKKYADDFPVTNCTGLVILGKAGLGKSFSMAALAKDIIKKTPKVCFIRSFELFESFHAHRLGKGNSLRPLNDCDVIFIDDLGTEPFTGNVTREYLFAFIDMRVNTKKHFIIASNLTEAQLMAHYGERLGSRILAYETSKKLTLIGEDIRLK